MTMLDLIVISILILGSISGTESTNCSTSCLQDPSNTTESCNATSGECLYGCAQGYYGFNCSTECSSNCVTPPSNQSDVCDVKTGNCTYGCKSGFTGLTCSCSENCVTDHDRSNDTCDPFNGECFLGCREGYAGPNCSYKCSLNCEFSSTNQSELCDATTGNCTHGCKTGFIGLACSCSEHCINSSQSNNGICDPISGECSLGCQQGYGGPNCTYECSPNCGIVPELGNDTCNITSGECRFGCIPGYAGLNCSIICPENCALPTKNNTETCNVTSNECLHGCSPGFAGPKCDFNCSDNCKTSTNIKSDTCNASNGECLLGCKYGYTGPNCTVLCPSNCGISDDLYTKTCNETSMSCFHGCIQGYAGPNCTYKCPENCIKPSTNDSRTCNETNGICSLGCLPGYAGPNCSFECPTNCSHPLQNNTDTCDYNTGQCLHGCKPGQAGPKCSFVCPSNCEPHAGNETETCNATTGECLYGCQSGYAGPNCSVECPSTCSSSNIRGADICNATSEECFFGCQEGYYGPRCENKCNDAIERCKRCSLQSDNSVICDECIKNVYRNDGKCIACNYWCLINISNPEPTCRESDGYCNHGCKAGRYGFKCGLQCPNTCKEKCDRDLGNCLIGCKPASYCGPTCALVCSDGCVSQDCEQSCTCRLGCTRKKWGDQCDKFCNVNCNEPPDSNSNICERSGGTCSFKCNNNTFWGSQCDKQCSSKCNDGICEQATGNCTGGCNSKMVYGIGCDKDCSKNCQNGTCERADGECDSGCVSGSYGERCNESCSNKCLKSNCHRKTAYCEYGCVGGWYGAKCGNECSSTCSEKGCDRNTGNCESCKSGYKGPKCLDVDIFDTNWIYVALACGAVVLLGVMITIVLVTKKRRLIAKRKRADRMSKIPDEKFLEEAQLRHRRKGEGAGARITQLFVENPLARFMKYRSHGGALITKIALDELLRKVLKMEENDYGREFDEFTVGLTKSHEASRKLDNLTLNFFNGIYPYDENRVILRHTFEDVTRKNKSKRGILKSVHFVTFRPTRDADYETLEVSTSSGGQEEETQKPKPAMHTTVGADKSNGYASVVFDISDETNGASAKPDNDISDDYATVEVGGGNKPSAITESNIPLDQLKTSEADRKEDSTEARTDDADAEYAQVDKSKKSSNAETGNDLSVENVHVNMAFDSSSIEQTENDEPYAVVHKDKKIKDKDDGDDRHFNKQSSKKDGSVVIQKDYINASFIKGYNQNERYIAAQAPSKATANDFWLMIWEQKSQFVIMLTLIPEDGYSRCEKYWPDKDDEETFGEIKVVGESVDEYADYIIRTFKMSLTNGQERDVVHMQFTSWPEEGCPVSAIEFIEFHQKYRSMTKGRHSVGPTIVHCTAGIGRTGVFLALDILVEEGLDSLSVDVFKCVTALREQRVDMVHSIEQYEFLYKAIAQTFALECQPYHKVRLQDRLAELKKFDHNSGKSKLEVLYDSMKASLGLDTVVIASLDVVQERKKKDRPKSDVPDALFRASLPRNIYINAVVFESSRKREAMVATQMPTPDTVQDFCQLLIHHQCATVIMLNNIDPNDKTIGAYWPTEKTPFVAGQTIITQLHVEKQSDYVIRQLRIHNPELIAGEGSAQAVTMIQYKGWKIVKNVPSAKNLLKLLQLCQRYIKDSPDKRLLVHCMDGAEQSGLFCALVNLLECVDTEDEISVTSVVRKILARRPNAIPTLDQFEVCFSTTCEYIKKHESA